MTEPPRSVTALPKAHLHLHFTGSMRVETVRDLAAAHGIRLPSLLTDEWPPRFAATDQRGWFRFQRLYDAARACVRSEADMRRIVREAAHDEAPGDEHDKRGTCEREPEREALAREDHRGETPGSPSRRVSCSSPGAWW